MTRFEPTLLVRRMLVQREERSVYDETFHLGVNVIRGTNSSGKSTILNFIFYGLGGDVLEWSPIASLCSRVLVEVSINGQIATLSRDVSETAQRPMEIFGGGLVEALEAPRAQWIRYGYRRYEERESFSQTLFRLMKMPEVASDTSGNITINQLLRLVYADQLSPIEQIFKYQSQFDESGLRDTVGRLLIGAYSSKLYENEQEIRQLTKDYDTATGEWRGLLAVVNRADKSFNLEWIEAQRGSLEAETITVAKAIEDAERELYEAQGKDEITLGSQQNAYQAFLTIQRQLAATQAERDNHALKIADSTRFITSLKSKLQALQDASTVAEVIGDVRFNECPACHAPVENSFPHSCYLCKTPFDAEGERGKIVAMINDTALQINQSEAIQRKRHEKAAEIDNQIRIIRSKWRPRQPHLMS